VELEKKTRKRKGKEAALKSFQSGKRGNGRPEKIIEKNHGGRERGQTREKTVRGVADDDCHADWCQRLEPAALLTLVRSEIGDNVQRRRGVRDEYGEDSLVGRDKLPDGMAHRGRPRGGI